MESKQQHYSLEIQGLRGISILAVMAFHFGGVPLPGGYTGVDMFFVISGYVITGLILREHGAGIFTLARFYKNRAIRLLPNLFAMIVATVVISWALLLPYDFMQYGKSLQFTAIYVTNMVFARQQGYFDLSREVKPLLHTWSLSIEEQFYLFFPLLLILLWSFRHSRWIVFGTLMLASLFWKYHLLEHDATSAFFSFPGRIWEFMIGAMAAQAPAAFRQRVARNEWLSAVSLLLIALTFVYLDERIAWSGLWVAVPCLATAALILASRDTRAGILLGHPWLVFIGAISYSLYLWHWPLLVMTRNLDWEISALAQLPILLAATFAIAYPAWRYIEAPLHHNKDRYDGKRVSWGIGGFAIFVIAVGGYVYAKEGLPNRFPHWVEVRENLQGFNFEQAAGVKGNPLTDCKLSGDVTQNLSSCSIFGYAGAQQKFLIIGDSHVWVWQPAFDVVAQRQHRMGIASSLPGCPPLLGVHTVDVDKNICETELESKLARMLDQIGPVQTVYLISHWNMYAEGNRIKGELQRPSMLISDDETESLEAEQSKRVIDKAFQRTVEFFKMRGMEVVVVLDVPSLPSVIQNLPDNYRLPLVTYHAQGEFMSGMTARMAKNYPEVHVYNPGDVLCSNVGCITKLNGNYMYNDNNHLSRAGSAAMIGLVERMMVAKQ